MLKKLFLLLILLAIGCKKDDPTAVEEISFLKKYEGVVWEMALKFSYQDYPSLHYITFNDDSDRIGNLTLNKGGLKNPFYCQELFIGYDPENQQEISVVVNKNDLLRLLIKHDDGTSQLATFTAKDNKLYMSGMFLSEYFDGFDLFRTTSETPCQ